MAEKRVRLGISITGSINWLRATAGYAGNKTATSGSTSGEFRAVEIYSSNL